LKAWHEGSAPKPASRTPKHRVERAAQALFNGQADGHTVQETPVAHTVQGTPVAHTVQGTPVARGATEQQPFRQEQITKTPPRTAHEREHHVVPQLDAEARAVHGGEFEVQRAERQPTAACPRGGEDVEPVDRLAVEALRRFGVWHDKAKDIVAKHGGALVLACLDVHRRAKNLGVALFVKRMDSEDLEGVFEHRDGTRTIRPTRRGNLAITNGDGSRPVIRRQTIRDYERVAQGGHLRTVAEGDLSPCD
jgi:hypothetical protein